MATVFPLVLSSSVAAQALLETTNVEVADRAELLAIAKALAAVGGKLSTDVHIAAAALEEHAIVEPRVR